MQTSGSRMERRLYSKLYKITEVLYYRYSGGKNFNFITEPRYYATIK